MSDHVDEFREGLGDDVCWEPTPWPDEFQADTPRPAANGHAPEDDVELDESLYPIDLEPVVAGTSLQPLPELLTRNDGCALIYPGAVNGIHGDSGVGKGWINCALIQQNARRARRTLLLDLEDTAHSIVSRLLLLGMQPDDIVRWLVYLRPQVPLGPLAVDHLVQLVHKHNAACLIVDSLGEAFALAGVNEDKDAEVGPWLRKVARPLADTGTAVVLIDHSTKAADNPLHPSGSKRKRAAITGASYLVEALQPFVKGQGGRLRLTCAKDRHGNHRRGSPVGDLVMDSDPDNITLNLYAPPTTSTDTTAPTILAARSAVAAARDAGRPLSRNALEGMMTMKSRVEVKRGGIDYAVSTGALIEVIGPRRARLVSYAHDLTE